MIVRKIFCNTFVYRAGVPLLQRPRAFEVVAGHIVRFFDEPFPNEKAEHIDLKGQFTYPGFFDSHTHFVWGGSALGPLNLSGVDSLEVMRERIHEAIVVERAANGRGWLLGLGLDQSKLHPTIEQLDEWSQEFPLLIETKDLHSAIANRIALERADCWRMQDHPEGGIIERDEHGIPNGWLREFAVHYVKRGIPAATPADYRRWFDAAAHHALSLGVIGVGENATCELAEHYVKWDVEGSLPLRIDLWLNEGWPNEQTLQFPKRHSSHLRIATQKMFLDGALGSHTAWFLEPYTSRPNTVGFPLHSDEELHNTLRDVLSNGWEAAIHTIGDASCEQLLRVCEALHDAGNDVSGVIAEHLQVHSSGAPERLSRLKMTASMQPIHLAGDREWMEDRIGAERCTRAFAWRSLREAGVTLRFGSDWPVEQLNPIPGLRTAVLRTGYTANSGPAWNPQEALKFEEALECFTTIPHQRAGWRETGSLREGATADFIVSDTELSTTDPNDWQDTVVTAVFLMGNPVR